MEDNAIQLNHCYCGGNIKMTPVCRNAGMDGSYKDWEFSCDKCGATTYYAADSFYGRSYYSKEEAISEWNKRHDSEKVYTTSEVVVTLEELILNATDYIENDGCDAREIYEKLIREEIERFKGDYIT